MNNYEKICPYLNAFSIIQSLLNSSIIDEDEYNELEETIAKKYELPDTSIFRKNNLKHIDDKS